MAALILFVFAALTFAADLFGCIAAHALANEDNK
jgi:hypothetical protein